MTSSIQRGVFKSLNQTHVTYLCVLQFYGVNKRQWQKCKSGTKILLSLRPGFFDALDLMSWLKKVTATVVFHDLAL